MIGAASLFFRGFVALCENSFDRTKPQNHKVVARQ